MAEPMTNLTISVPTDQVVRVMTALRGGYTSLTQGKGNEAAFAAVMKHWLTEAVASEEIRQTKPARDAAIDAARVQLDADMAAWRESVRDDLAGITVAG